MALETTLESQDNLDVEVELLKLVTVKSGQNLTRGDLVKQVDFKSASTGTAGGSNTGNGTISAITAKDYAKIGTYTLACTAASADAGTFSITDPDGIVVETAVTVGVAYDGILGFTISDGATDFAEGDTFTTVVTETAGKVEAYTTGSEPYTIMYDTVDATSGDVIGNAYREAYIKASEVDFGTGTDAEVRNRLDAKGIHLRD